MGEHSDSRASPAQGKDLKCRDCDSILGSISVNGSLNPIPVREGQACDTCRPFEELHAMVLTADEAFAKVEHRRPDFGGRVFAVHAQRAAHKAIANFLLGIERTDQTPFRITSTRPEQGQQQASAPSHQRTDEFHSGQKRPGSPTFGEYSSQLPKRRRSKRVSFDASVVVRDDNEIRGTDAFQRNSQRYFPGRNAASEGTEFLDTSGWGLDFKDFHRLQWAGRKWIPRLEFDEEEFDNNKKEYTGNPHLREAAGRSKEEAKGTTGADIPSDSPSATNHIPSEKLCQIASIKEQLKGNVTDGNPSYRGVVDRKEERVLEVRGMNLIVGGGIGLSTSGYGAGEVIERRTGAAEKETRAGAVENTTN